MEDGHPTHCVVCRSGSVRAMPFYYLWRGRRWSILRCRECTHGFVHPLLGWADQEAIYNDRYFAAEGDWVEGVWPLGYIEAEANLRREATEVLDMLPRREGRILEVGCAGGFFLDEARRRGFEVMGIEFNAHMAAYARALGLDVILGRIEDIAPDRIPQNNYHALVLMDVLEHIPDPYAVLAKTRAWLTLDSCIVIRGPLHNDPLARVKEEIRRAIRLTRQLPGYPLDANFFTKTSLTRLLAQLGFGGLVWINETRGFANVVASRHGAPAPQGGA